MRNSPIYYTRHYFGLILQNYLTTYHPGFPDDKLFITSRLDKAYTKTFQGVNLDWRTGALSLLFSVYLIKFKFTLIHQPVIASLLK